MAITRCSIATILFLLTVATHGRAFDSAKLSSRTNFSLAQRAVEYTGDDTSSSPVTVVARQTTQQKYVDDPLQLSFPFTSDRVVVSFVRCPCSPGTRGYSPAVLDHVREMLEMLNRNSGAAATSDEARQSFRKRHGAEAVKIYNEAHKVFKREALINADFTLRGEYRFTFCSYDKVTGRNVYTLTDGTSTAIARRITVGQCRNESLYRSPARFLTARPANTTRTPKTSSVASPEPISVPAETSTTKKTKAALPKAGIAGIAVVAAVLVCAVLALIAVRMRRRSTSKAISPSKTPFPESRSSTGGNESGTSAHKLNTGSDAPSPMKADATQPPPDHPPPPPAIYCAYPDVEVARPSAPPVPQFVGGASDMSVTSGSTIVAPELPASWLSGANYRPLVGANVTNGGQ